MYSFEFLLIPKINFTASPRNYTYHLQATDCIYWKENKMWTLETYEWKLELPFLHLQGDWIDVKPLFWFHLTQKELLEEQLMPESVFSWHLCGDREKIHPNGCIWTLPVSSALLGYLLWFQLLWSGDLQPEWFCLPGTFSNIWRHLVVKLGGLLLAVGGQRAGLLLTILKCPGKPPQQRIFWPEYQ